MARNKRKQWSELGRGSRRAIVAVGVLQFVLQGAALRDIAQRTPAQVNGSRKGWVAASFINFAGPIAYFVWGRKK